MRGEPASAGRLRNMVAPEAPARPPLARSECGSDPLARRRHPLRRAWGWMSLFTLLVAVVEVFRIPIWADEMGDLVLFMAACVFNAALLAPGIGALRWLVLALLALVRALRPVDRGTSQRRMPRELLCSGAVGFGLSLVPFAVMAGGRWLHVGDRVFIARHRAALEGALRRSESGEGGEFHVMWTHGDAQVIGACISGFDLYWLVHDPCGDPWGAHPDIGGIHRLEHVEGPWFSMVH